MGEGIEGGGMMDKQKKPVLKNGENYWVRLNANRDWVIGQWIEEELAFSVGEWNDWPISQEETVEVLEMLQKPPKTKKGFTTRLVVELVEPKRERRRNRGEI